MAKGAKHFSFNGHAGEQEGRKWEQASAEDKNTSVHIC